MLIFVNMGDNALAAKNMGAALFVNMGDGSIVAKNVAAGATGRCRKGVHWNIAVCCYSIISFSSCILTPVASSALIV